MQRKAEETISHIPGVASFRKDAVKGCSAVGHQVRLRDGTSRPDSAVCAKAMTTNSTPM